MSRAALSVLAAAAAFASPGRAAPRPPNIVFILADDLGYGEASCYGETRYRTPNIDALASQGIRLTEHYAGAPECSPSRCALMTGYHTGHGRNRANFGAGPEGEAIRVGLEPEDRTVAEVLHAGGYATACIGKWGLGEEGTPGVPWKQGFDLFYGMLNDTQAHSHFPEFLYRNAEKEALVENFGHKQGRFADDLYTREAERFIGEHRFGAPFFLYLAYISPHVEITPPADAVEEVRRLYPALTRPPATARDLLYAAMVVRLDDHVGEICRCLDRLGLGGETLVVFASDNGPAGRKENDSEFFRSAGGLRGIKRDLYEGGIREPFIARWPGRIPAGTVSSQPSAFWDFLPTAAEVAGLAPPAGIDGLSYLNVLLGRPAPEHPFFYWEYGFNGKAEQAVRAGQWKGVRRGGPTAPLELYDLRTDPGERRNVAGSHPEVTRRLEAILSREHVEDAQFPLSPRRRRTPADE